MTKDDKEIVSALVKALADRVGPARFDLWCVPHARFELADRQLCVYAANAFRLETIKRCLRDELRAVLEQFSGRCDGVRFEVSAENSTEDDVAVSPPDPPALSPPASARAARAELPVRGAHEREPRLRAPVAAAAPRRTVEGVALADLPDAAADISRRAADRSPAFAAPTLHDFMVGEGNRLAYTAALQVIQRAGHVSPVFFYGPPGCGKSHLLQGLAAALREKGGGSRVMALTAEQFTTDFLDALHSKGLPSFRAKYRSLHVLLIDDAQFFRRKHATMVELQHTVDTLLRAGRQVIFTADRSPGELAGLGAELIARLSGGLVCGLDPADEPTRFKILQRLAVKIGVCIPDAVLRGIAHRAVGDARQLAGIVHRLAAESQTRQQPVTAESAELWLTDLLQTSRQVVGLADIDLAVCDVFGVDSRTLHSARRSKALSQPRMLAMWLARKYTRAAFSEIGQHFGRRSHSTVISASRKVDQWMADGETIQIAFGHCDVREAIRRIETHLRTG